MRQLTQTQIYLLRELDNSPNGFLFVSGGEYRTAYSLAKRGIVTLGCRHWNTHEVVTPYTKGWCHTVEKLKNLSTSVVVKP